MSGLLTSSSGWFGPSPQSSVSQLADAQRENARLLQEARETDEQLANESSILAACIEEEHVAQRSAEEQRAGVIAALEERIAAAEKETERVEGVALDAAKRAEMATAAAAISKTEIEFEVNRLHDLALEERAAEDHIVSQMDRSRTDHDVAVGKLQVWLRAQREAGAKDTAACEATIRERERDVAAVAVEIRSLEQECSTTAKELAKFADVSSKLADTNREIARLEQEQQEEEEEMRECEGLHDQWFDRISDLRSELHQLQNSDSLKRLKETKSETEAVQQSLDDVRAALAEVEADLAQLRAKPAVRTFGHTVDSLELRAGLAFLNPDEHDAVLEMLEELREVARERTKAVWKSLAGRLTAKRAAKAVRSPLTAAVAASKLAAAGRSGRPADSPTAAADAAAAGSGAATRPRAICWCRLCGYGPIRRPAAECGECGAPASYGRDRVVMWQQYTMWWLRRRLDAAGRRQRLVSELEAVLERAELREERRTELARASQPQPQHRRRPEEVQERLPAPAQQPPPIPPRQTVDLSAPWWRKGSAPPPPVVDAGACAVRWGGGAPASVAAAAGSGSRAPPPLRPLLQTAAQRF